MLNVQLQSNLQGSEARRDELAEAEKKVESKAELLQQRVKVLEEASAAAEVHVREFESEIDSRAIKRADVRVIHTPDRKDDAIEVVSRINELGGSAYRYPATSEPKQFIGKAFYSSKSQLEAIQQIASAISDIETIEPKESDIKFGSGDISLWLLPIR